MEMNKVLISVIAAVLLATTMTAHAEDDTDPRWNMWVDDLRAHLTVLSDAWIFQNDCRRKMADAGEDEALSSALSYMADHFPRQYHQAQFAARPFFSKLNRTQQQRYCDAAERKLNGLAARTR
jgi:hypothetical protein